MIQVATDSDFKATMANKEISDKVGITLAEKYPGYQWRIEPNAHPTKPFVDIRLEQAGTTAMLGYTVKLHEMYSDSSLKKEVIKAGGVLLEVSGLNRRSFDEPEFLSRPKNFAGLIAPMM